MKIKRVDLLLGLMFSEVALKELQNEWGSVAGDLVSETEHYQDLSIAIETILKLQQEAGMKNKFYIELI